MQPKRVELTDMRNPHVPSRVSVPFERGECGDAMDTVIRDGRGRAVPAQGRSILDWDDGSCKWGLFVFEPGDDGGPFVLEGGSRDGAETPLVVDDGDLYRLDTGRIVAEIPLVRNCPNAICYPPFLASLSHRDGDGSLHPILRGTPDAGLRILEEDGRTYLSERTLASNVLRHPPLRCRDRTVELIENGPVRAWLQIRGIAASDIFMPGLDYVIQIEAYRDSSLVKLTVTWRHADDEVFHHVRDLRFALPFAQRAQAVTTGMQHGATTDNLLPGSQYRVLQEDEHTYYADRLDPSGERVGLAWGSGHGQRAPGWMQARFTDARLSVAMRDFVREYPNEIRVDENEVSFGLWPVDAAGRIAAKRLLPVHPDADADPELRHRLTKYDNHACHPYWAFLDRDSLCLETVRGMQKTQVVWCDTAPDMDEVEWSRRVTGDALEINQARVACEDLRRSTIYGYVHQLDREKNPDFSRVLDAGATWLKNHEQAYSATGKFDAGDLYYMWMSQSRSKDTDPKHTARREHSRMGYWNNNEEDPCHGLHTYFLATGDVEAYRTASRMARHLWDIDVRHYPQMGMYTHGFGHCFRAYRASATDHFWIEGLLDHYLIEGDPETRRGIAGMTEFLAQETADVEPAFSDLRTLSLLLMQLANYSDFGDRVAMLDRARQLAADMIAEQNPSGYFPRWGSKAVQKFVEEERPGYATPASGGQSTWFSTLALQGLMGLWSIDPDARWLEAFYRQLDFITGHCLFGEYSLPDERTRLDADTLASPGEPEAGWSAYEMQRILVFAYGNRGDDRYLELGRRMMGYFTAAEFCGPEWGERMEGLPVPGSSANPEGTGMVATPETHTELVRPLVPSTTLRCLPAMMALLLED